jgi:hypothetical protein
MSKRVRCSKLESPSARAALPISTKPVWTRLMPHAKIGYRRNKAGGTFSVKYIPPKGQGGARSPESDRAAQRQLAKAWRDLSVKPASVPGKKKPGGLAATGLLIFRLASRPWPKDGGFRFFHESWREAAGHLPNEGFGRAVFIGRIVF